MNPASPPEALQYAQRTREIEPFFVMEVQRRALELQAAGRDIIHLEIGQPDFGAPEPVLARAHEVLRSSTLGYTDTLGLHPLREAISAWYQSRFDVSVEPERILVTTGASGALMVLLGSLVNPGDEFLLPDPGYPCNRHFVRMFEGKAHLVPTDPENAFQPTLEQLKLRWGPDTRGVILGSPANPTGTCIEPTELARIHAWVRARGGALVVDEIYQGLVYGRHPATALSLGDDVFVINSFSKYFGMTGWRLGWLVAPGDWIRTLERFAQNAYICPPTLAQHAALAAFTDESLAICEAHCKEYRARRDGFLPQLSHLGFQVPAVPTGAFYIYADCASFQRQSSQLVRDLLEATGVAITPGCDFGVSQADRFVRFAYAQPRDRLDEAVARLERYLL